MKLDVINLDAKKAGSVELNDAVFGIEDVRPDILQRMVRYQLAKRQAGTHKTQTRSEVNKTKTRFGRQKGGGGARHGSRNAPIFVGGGVAHGPKVRSHAHDLTKKFRALALKHALSAKVKDSSLIVLEEAAVSEVKTKALRAQFEALGLKNALVIGGESLDDNFAKAARNIPNIDVLPFAGLNVYDVMRRHTLVLTKEAVDAVHARFDGSSASALDFTGDNFVDEIVVVDGIGAQSAKTLAKAGYATLSSVAALSAADAAKVFEAAGYGPRAAREDWHGQAKEMVSGKPPRAKVDQRYVAQVIAKRAKEA
ncbi:ribosomal protein L4/L1e [Hirschia baltica ATCC 49814]|uniref:Large ribosomal subunit protein uL4 n=1 Tax=Hirschia baltica (strain ATCC 49814 / DSM 5838 / IFAM 1418) TaxID=582402 RepID=C6XLG6_HIRBI|nr:50S ribosomal protein L4 [Hirschia baltica]ACT59765.1 ribosomal protein L4/L1e [Hirschia baltica ATCC 49814]